MNTPSKIAVIGSGNVAWHLTRALKNVGVQTVWVVGRTKSSIQKIATDNAVLPVFGIENTPTNAEIILVCVHDSAIAIVGQQLPKTKAIVAHTSGAQDLSVLQMCTNYGVFYPLQTFTKFTETDFSKLPILLEGNTNSTQKTLVNLAQKLSENVFEISSEQREKLHVAAVFANNFTNHMLAHAHAFCQENKVPFETLHSLILETAKKATKQNPAKSQTGPAFRNDDKTLEKHRKLIRNAHQLELYNFITKSIKIAK